MSKTSILRISMATVVVAGLGGWYFWHLSTLSANLDITAVPLSSKVLVNGHSAKHGLNKTEPGQKKVTVSMDGFTSGSQTVSVAKGETKKVDIVLTSNSSKTANWYATHPKDEQQAEGVSSRAVDNLAKQSVQQSPLIRLLPFVAGGMEFRVDYGNPPGQLNAPPAIYITAPTAAAQQDGLNWIKSLGYDPADYEIKLVTGEVKPLNS